MCVSESLGGDQAECVEQNRRKYDLEDLKTGNYAS